MTKGTLLNEWWANILMLCLELNTFYFEDDMT